MGLTDSYAEFMADPSVRDKEFEAVQGTSANDSASFAATAKADKAKGLISINVMPGNNSWHIVKGAKAMERETPMGAGNKLAADVAKTPWRVDLNDMKKRVVSEEFIFPKTIPHMTICVLILDNGYALQGMSAPADPANFNEEVGKKFAHEDAIKKMWALEAYVMRDYMTGKVSIEDTAQRWSVPA